MKKQLMRIHVRRPTGMQRKNNNIIRYLLTFYFRHSETVSRSLKQQLL